MSLTYSVDPEGIWSNSGGPLVNSVPYSERVTYLLPVPEVNSLSHLQCGPRGHLPFWKSKQAFVADCGTESGLLARRRRGDSSSQRSWRPGSPGRAGQPPRRSGPPDRAAPLCQAGSGGGGARLVPRTVPPTPCGGCGVWTFSNFGWNNPYDWFELLMYTCKSVSCLIGLVCSKCYVNIVIHLPVLLLKNSFKKVFQKRDVR